MKKVGKIFKQSAKGFNDVMGPVASIAKTVAPLIPLMLALGRAIWKQNQSSPKGSVCPKSQKSATWMQKVQKGPCARAQGWGW